MGSIRRFATLALATTLVGCAGFERWLDKLEGKEPSERDTRSAAAPPKPAPKPAAPPAKPEPPPPTWSMAFPGGSSVKFGAIESFPEVDPLAIEQLVAELCSAGWTREFMAYPEIYFLKIDNRNGKGDLVWSSQDRVIAAGNGRTYEPESKFRYAAVLKRFGGYEQTVMVGTSGVVPVVFANTLPLRSLTALKIQSDGRSIALVRDTSPEGTAGKAVAAPAR